MSDPIVDGIDLDALNYTVKVPYNGSIMTGGDSLTSDLNIFYDVSLPPQDSPARSNTLQAGDIAWMITSTALVLLMIPGVG
jgi:Amt family ammonium transporter